MDWQDKSISQLEDLVRAGSEMLFGKPAELLTTREVWLGKLRLILMARTEVGRLLFVHATEVSMYDFGDHTDARRAYCTEMDEMESKYGLSAGWLPASYLGNKSTGVVIIKFLVDSLVREAMSLTQQDMEQQILDYMAGCLWVYNMQAPEKTMGLFSYIGEDLYIITGAVEIVEQDRLGTVELKTAELPTNANRRRN